MLFFFFTLLQKTTNAHPSFESSKSMAIRVIYAVTFFAFENKIITNLPPHHNFRR